MVQASSRCSASRRALLTSMLLMVLPASVSLLAKSLLRTVSPPVSQVNYASFGVNMSDPLKIWKVACSNGEFMLRKIILISAQIKAAIALATGGLRGELATKTCLFCSFLVTQIAFYSVLFASPFHYLFNQVRQICMTYVWRYIGLINCLSLRRKVDAYDIWIVH